MRTMTVHVGWGCLGLATAAALLVLAVAVQAVLAVAAVVGAVIAHG